MINLKIGARLGFAFGFVLALMALIVLIAVSRLSILNAGTDHVVHNAYPKVVTAYEIEGQINVIARGLRNLLLTSDGKTRQNRGQ